MDPPAQRGTIRRTVFLCLLAVIFAALFDVVYTLYHLINVVIPHSYAAWTTGDLLVEYMDTHDGKWPTGWEDLRGVTNSLAEKHIPMYWRFDQLPGLVRIDWTAQPESLAKAARAGGTAQMKVVTRLDGSKLEAKWGPNTEPNRKVAVYLMQRYSTNAIPKPKSASK